MNQGRIIVITGAPGTGKTTTASAVAKEPVRLYRRYGAVKEACPEGLKISFGQAIITTENRELLY